MRRRALAALIVLVTVACGGPSSTPAPAPPPALDWPLFRGDLERDGHPAGASLGPTQAAHLQRAWSVDLGSEIVASPVVAGGVVVVGTLGGVLAAYGTRQGDELWRVTGLGPLAGTPAISGGKVVIGSTEGRLYAFDLENGSLIWDWRAPGSRPALSGSVAVFRGLLIVGVGAQPEAAGKVPGRLLALDPASGDQVWSTCARPRCESGSTLTSSPAIDAGGHAFIGLGSPENALWALDVGIGKEVWRSPAQPAPGAGPEVASTPLVIYRKQGESVAVAGAAGTVALFEARTGRLTWSRQLSTGLPAGAISGSLAWDGTALYVPLGGAAAGLAALSPVDGHTLWSRASAEPVLSSPALGRGVVVVGTGSGASRGSGAVLALGAADGGVLWTFPTAAMVASPALVGDSVYAADRAGTLSAFRPGP